MLTNRTQAAMARVLAEYAAGTVGFHARMMHDLTPTEFRALGKQADAELLSRDRVIMQQRGQIEQQQARITLLEAEVLRLKEKIAADKTEK